jgi:hypothetical protein
VQVLGKIKGYPAWPGQVSALAQRDERIVIPRRERGDWTGNDGDAAVGGETLRVECPGYTALSAAGLARREAVERAREERVGPGKGEAEPVESGRER